MNDQEIVIKQMELGPMMNFVYLIGCPEGHMAAVVDPAWDVPRIVDEVRKLGLTLSHVLLTHLHPDHANGLEELLRTTNAVVCIHTEEIGYAQEMARRFQISLEFLEQYAPRIISVTDGQEIPLGGLVIRCLHTPGHTPGSQCFLAGKNLFSGDTLFVDACGRVDLPGGDSDKMWWSLTRKLGSLEDDIVLYPGHDYGHQPTASLGEQKRTNPYMRFATADEFRRAM
jgi:hydroxyacylglutathione hydrolase